MHTENSLTFQVQYNLHISAGGMQKSANGMQKSKDRTACFMCKHIYPVARRYTVLHHTTV